MNNQNSILFEVAFHFHHFLDQLLLLLKFLRWSILAYLKTLQHLHALCCFRLFLLQIRLCNYPFLLSEIKIKKHHFHWKAAFIISMDCTKIRNEWKYLLAFQLRCKRFEDPVVSPPSDNSTLLILNHKCICHPFPFQQNLPQGKVWFHNLPQLDWHLLFL